jgi:quercetin dioxygenase-like cupin family protein
VIYPADDPHTAELSLGARSVRLSTPGAQPLSDDLPAFRPEFVLTREGASSAEGRAGMLYRDLIPGRLGGRYIASHITILDGGPVADWVHHHAIALQLIFVRRGWVRVVYEDQGDPFVMDAGDLVVQPPHIRHRVLESSPGLEVIEISAPALHKTFADHGLDLPNGVDRDRTFDGQRFLWHRAETAPWSAWNGAEVQETALGESSGGIAEARVIRPANAPRIDFAPDEGELVFGFVLEGSAYLDGNELGPAASFAIPPDRQWSLSQMSPDFRLLHVTTTRLDAAAR